MTTDYEHFLTTLLVDLVAESSAAGFAAAAELLASGATVPFVARYRKEATGGLDDEALEQLKSLGYIQ